MQGQKLLMLCWRSFLGHIRNVATTIILLKGGQYFDYDLLLLHSLQDVQVRISKNREGSGDAHL